MTPEKQALHAESSATGLVARAESLAAEINKLASEVDAVSVLNPMSILTLLQRGNDRETLRPKVKTLLGESLAQCVPLKAVPGLLLALFNRLRWVSLSPLPY